MPIRADFNPENDTPFDADLAARDPFADCPKADEYDALAELFLGAPDTGVNGLVEPQEPDNPGVGRSSEVELLLLGHLPGASAAWPAQYAAATAERDGAPIGLVRLDEGELSVDLVGAPALSRPARTAPDAIARLRGMTRRVLVRTDAPVDVFLKSAPPGAAVTVLTGANEAAVVAAYRLIKSASALAPNSSFRVAVMGADEIEAHRAVAHLRDAVSSFLDGELVEAPAVRRVAPAPRANLHRGPAIGGPAAILRLLTDPAEDPSRSSDELPAPEPMFFTPAEPLAPIAPIARQPTTIEAGADVSRETTPAPATANAPATLASRVPGLTTIESRCPYHPGVELAVDRAGRMCGLVRGGVGEVGPLLAVKAWARDHARILARAEPALREADAEESFAMHLLTDQPASARGLIGSGVRVHVLAQAGPDGWVCLPLNDE